MVHVSRTGDLVRGVLRRLRPAPTAPRGERPDPEVLREPSPSESGANELPLEVERPPVDAFLLDIREPGELAGGVARGAVLLPMNLVPHHLSELPRDRTIVVYCAAGARSFGVAHWLREQGFPMAVSLAGGIGVFDAIGHAVATPPGILPGTRVRVPPEATLGGHPLGLAAWGEVIEQVGSALRVVVQDEQGFLVRVEMAAP